MANHQTPKSELRKQKSAVPNEMAGRVIWLTVAVILLSAMAIGIWLWAHAGAAPAQPEARPRIASPSPTESESDTPRLIPLRPAFAGDGGRWYPSPFRSSAPETAEESAPESEPETRMLDRGGELIYHGRRNDRMEIALSFDDGPHPRYTPQILDILAEYGVRATFFMVGENVGYYPKAAEAVAAAGHEIGNHTFTHRRFNLMSEHEMLREIAACEDAISSVSEQKPQFIRPPEGQLNETMRRVIGTLDYRIVLWDVDTRDWAHTPPDAICQHILDTVQAGDIILMHDFIGHDSPTPEALRLVIPALLARGYHFVTVGELVDGIE